MTSVCWNSILYNLLLPWTEDADDICVSLPGERTHSSSAIIHVGHNSEPTGWNSVRLIALRVGFHEQMKHVRDLWEIFNFDSLHFYCPNCNLQKCSTDLLEFWEKYLLRHLCMSLTGHRIYLQILKKLLTAFSQPHITDTSKLWQHYSRITDIYSM